MSLVDTSCCNGNITLILGGAMLTFSPTIYACASEINPPEASSKDGKRVRKKHVAAHGVVSKLPPISDA